jgi:hypothetical protein
MSPLLRAALQEHQALCKSFASRLANDGDNENALKELGQWEEDEGQQERLEEERRRVIQLAVQCDYGMSMIDHDLANLVGRQHLEPKALDEIIQKIESGPVKSSGGTTTSRPPVGNYETEIRSILGMTTGKQEDEDEELAVVGGGGGGRRNSDVGATLRCPLTGKLLEDPVKNSVCGHAYSKKAIQAHLAISSLCPVAGCRNEQVRWQHLKVNDVELTQLLRRHKRREDAEREQRQFSQVLDDEDDDEDDDGVGGDDQASSNPGRFKERVKRE